MGDPNRRTPEMDEALRTSTGALELPAFESLTDEQVKQQAGAALADAALAKGARVIDDLENERMHAEQAAELEQT